jgi:hypothetical protein
MADFAPSLPPESKEKEEKLHAQAARKRTKGRKVFASHRPKKFRELVDFAVSRSTLS